MNVFIIGGTGQIGSLVASGLVAKGAQVRVLTRDARKASALPEGQTGVVGDLFDVALLKAEIARSDAMFMMFPPIDTMCFAGLTVLAIAAETRPKHVVMMTGQDCRLHAAAGHIGSMVPPEIVLEESGLSHTLLNPNYFFQNDERHKDPILSGLYPTPVGDVGLSRCDVRDIADAAVAGFDRVGTKERVRVCGPDVLTGNDMAAEWTRALGRTVRYGGHDDMDGFERKVAESGAAPHWALDLRVMYESFQRTGLVATPEDVDRLGQLLGQAPRRYASFVDETARRWQG